MRFAAHGAQPVASASADHNLPVRFAAHDSLDSYNGDDVRHYLHERNEVIDRYLETTREIGHLELTLNASQAALAATDGESSIARAQLAESNTRVIGKIFRKTPPFYHLHFVAPFLTIHVLLIAALMEQLEALQLAANNAAGALNARGDLLANCLQDIPVCTGQIALHGVHHGATVALTIA